MRLILYLALWLSMIALSFGLPTREGVYLEVYDYSKGWIPLNISRRELIHSYNMEHMFVGYTFLNVYIYDERHHQLRKIPRSAEEVHVNEFLVAIRTMDGVIIYDSIKGKLEEYQLRAELLKRVLLNQPSLLLYNAGLEDLAVPMAVIITDKRVCVYQAPIGIRCHRLSVMNSDVRWSLSDRMVAFTDYTRPVVYDPIVGDFVEGSSELSVPAVSVCPLRGATALSSAGVQIYDPVKRRWVRSLGNFTGVGCDYRSVWVSTLTSRVSLYVFGEGWRT